MADINVVNRFTLRQAQREGGEVAFSYNAKSDGHERVVVGNIANVTENHVCIEDRVRAGSYRVFILDRIRGQVQRLKR